MRLNTTAAADWAAYSSSKFAIRGLTQAAGKFNQTPPPFKSFFSAFQRYDPCLAAEWKKHGITVNTYAPGAIDIPECMYLPGRVHVDNLNLCAAVMLI